MKSFKSFLLKEAVEYHKEHNIPVYDSIFRYGSEGYFALIEEYRLSDPILTQDEKDFLDSDIGKFGIYEGKEVPLDLPMEILSEEQYKGKDVVLNKPKRGGRKKFYVYVKNDKGNVIKVQFGDTSGLQVKINDPKARASFVARHKCKERNDKTKPSYWACRLPRFAKSLGLSGGNRNIFW
jgi:hypothetical protein